MEERYALFANDTIILAIVENNKCFVREYDVETKRQKKKEEVLTISQWEKRWDIQKEEHIVLQEPLRGVQRILSNIKEDTKEVLHLGLKNLRRKFLDKN